MVFSTDAASEQACRNDCCDADELTCTGYTFMPNAADEEKCSLYAEGFHEGKPTFTDQEDVRHGWMKTQCTDNFSPHLTKGEGNGVYWKLYDDFTIDETRNEAECARECCEENDCTGYKWYAHNADGRHHRNGPCRIYYAPFWLGSHERSAHGGIIQKRKLQDCSGDGESDDSEIWENMTDRHVLGSDGYYK